MKKQNQEKWILALKLLKEKVFALERRVNEIENPKPLFYKNAEVEDVSLRDIKRRN